MSVVHADAKLLEENSADPTKYFPTRSKEKPSVINLIKVKCPENPRVGNSTGYVSSGSRLDRVDMQHDHVDTRKKWAGLSIKCKLRPICLISRGVMEQNAQFRIFLSFTYGKL